MALEIKLTQKMSQSLLMTPQLQQAIKLLQLGRLEYIEAIERELLDNPILEESVESDPNRNKTSSLEEHADLSSRSKESSEEFVSNEHTQKEEAPIAWEDYLSNFSDSQGSAAPKNGGDGDSQPSLEATLSGATSLTEHLLSQIRFAELEPGDDTIILNIIGNLDRSGFLCITIDELVEQCSCDPARVMRVLAVVQSLDPIGIAARDLQESLLIQLAHAGLGESLSARIVRDHLDKLEKRKYDLIARAESATLEEVYASIKLIQSLEPRPAKDFSDDTIRYVVPDIYVHKNGSEYVISLNEEGLPRLRISPYYLEMLQKQEATDPESRQYLNDRLKAASWLIKSIHQRQQTIYRVTQSIVKFQKEFLDHGIERLRPLILKEVADDIGMHESTVSRVTTAKYVHTPQGVFELKFFFSTGIQSGDSSLSSNSIREKIKLIIASEEDANPISDQQIVELLDKEQIKIARRTVAKYRESLGILASSKRKKLF